MAIGGWAQGGASALGRSSAFDNLPWDGYREQEGWLEEWINAHGLEFDILYNAFCTAAARANLLDPAYASDQPENEYNATTTVAPTASRLQHTMLDIMLAAPGIPWPVHGDLTIAQRQALVTAAQEAFKRKGNRLHILNLAAQMTGEVIYGWSVPPFSASIILPDGAPSPGWGSWVPASGASASFRPWLLGEERRIAGRIFPAWSQMGVGYSQFRAGYSAAGEPAMVSGSRLNHLANEHFNAWGGGVPTSWTRLGTATLTQVTSNTYINYEFYDTTPTAPSVARLDLSAAGAGTFAGLRQACSVNNQLPHRVEVDYVYTNSQSVACLGIKIADLSTGVWWDDANEEWTSVETTNWVDPSTTRTRAAFDIELNAIPQASNVFGTESLRVDVLAISDGTATTMTTYDLYRVAVYERYDLDIEEEALGDRLLWAPLKDSAYLLGNNRAATAGLIAPANASRSRTRVFTDTPTIAAEYHPAISQHGIRCSTAWTNLLLGSVDFVTDWTTNAATVTAGGTSSPQYSTGGSTGTTASVAASAQPSQLYQTDLVANPNGNTYVAGFWAKRISGTATTVTLSLESTAVLSEHQATFDLTAEWQWCAGPPMAFTEVDPLAFVIYLNSADSVIGVYGAYCYDVTGKTDVRYPPVCRSAVGTTGSLTATQNTYAVTDPYTKRQTCSVVRGACKFTFVPTFGRNPGVTGHSQPNGVIFDIAEGAAQNRVCLRIASNVLELRRWDDAGNNHAATLTLAYTADAVTEVKWRRDEKITIYCSWNNVLTQLSAGDSNATQAVNGGWSANDDSLTAIGVGNDYNNSSPIDGIITGLEIVQIGRATV